MTAANQDDQYRCPDCGTWYVVNTLLRAHQAQEHPQEQPDEWEAALDACEDADDCPADYHHHDCPADTGHNCDAPELHTQG